MPAAKLIELDDGLKVFASSIMEVRFLHDEIFLAGCYDHVELPQRPVVRPQGPDLGLARHAARPAADVLGDHLPAQPVAVTFPAHRHRHVAWPAPRQIDPRRVGLRTVVITMHLLVLSGAASEPGFDNLARLACGPGRVA